MLSLADTAHHRFHKLYKRIVKFEADVCGDRDPESLHQMRVGMRRLRTALHVFDGVVWLPKAATENPVRKIAKRLGALRDLDVLQNRIITDYTPIVSEEEQRPLQNVVKKLHKHRKAALKDVRKALKGKKYKAFKRSLSHWLEHPQYGEIAHLLQAQALPELLQPAMTDVLRHPAWLIEVEPALLRQASDRTQSFLSNHQAELLHDLRKRMKHVRYQTEFFSDWYDDGDRYHLEQFKVLQDCLGQLQDCAVMRIALKDYIGKRWATKLPSLAYQLAEAENESWNQWRSLRHQYLHPAVRQSLRALTLIPDVAMADALPDRVTTHAIAPSASANAESSSHLESADPTEANGAIAPSSDHTSSDHNGHSIQASPSSNSDAAPT
jgi:CHAD domain-containing protein